MAKKKKSIVLTELDLAMYSDRLRNLINDYLPEDNKLTGNEVIAVGPGKGTLEIRTPNAELSGACVYDPSLVDEFDVTQVHLTEEDQKKHICGYITFAKILRSALSTFSWQFIEWIVVTYGAAFNEGELQLGEELSEDFVLDNVDAEGVIGVRRDFLTRWIEKGVVCKGDIVIREELHPVAEDDRQRAKLPINYPMLIVGHVLFLNQSLPTNYKVVGRLGKDDELAPMSVGAIVYESLGLAEVEQKGPEAVYTYMGQHYHADPLGVRLLEHASKKFH